MKYLFLLLVLAGCVQEKASSPAAEAEPEAVENRANTFIPKTIEDLDTLRHPISSYKVLNRLIPIEDYGFLNNNTQDIKSVDNKLYSIIYFDPVTYSYYYGKIITSNFFSNFSHFLDYRTITNYPFDDRNRFVPLTNLTPSKQVVVDARYFPKNTNLHIQIFNQTVDDYIIDQVALTTNPKPLIIEHYSKKEVPNLQWLPRTNEYTQVYYIGVTNGIPLDRLEEFRNKYTSPFEEIEMVTNQEGHIYITHFVSNKLVFIFSNTAVYQYTDWRVKDRGGDLLGPVEDSY